VTVGRIFLAFLFTGVTSFGGGIVAYLRTNLVTKHRWMEDKAFLEVLAISQTLPGLKATNIAILAGDRLRGTPGAVAAIVGLCLPGAVIMYIVGMVYRGVDSERPLVTAGLEGAAAAAVGLILAMTLQLGRQSLSHVFDLAFVLVTIIGVNHLDVPEPYVLIAVGALAIFWYRPRGTTTQKDSRP
jgi:chromate transporter